MPKHTPGEWSTSEENCAGGLNICDASGHYIGHTAERNNRGKHITTESAKANARLFSASPIGYDLAQAILDQERDGIDRSEHIKSLARKFMSKAEGSEQ